MLQNSTGAVAADGNVLEARTSAVTWSAIIAGAVATAAVSLILVALGTGFGLLSASPWPGAGASPTTFGVLAAIWLVIVQWVASGIGGYLTGRMRTKWVGIHTDEVTFRDTAHGFLAWGLGTLFAVAVLASATTSTLSGAARGATTVAAGVAQGASQGAAQQAAANPADPTAYFADVMLRPTAGATAPATTGANPSAEVGRILVNDIRTGTFSDADKAYLAQIVAARTGLSPADAMTRVKDVIGQAQAAAKDAADKARAAADAARKVAASFAIYAGLSMLIGAFVAAIAAALGGSRRDA